MIGRASWLCGIIFSVLSVVIEPAVHAADRALIVTIGQAYGKHGMKPITGPEKDCILAKELATTMGFQESDMKLIREEEATRAAVLGGLDWVKQGVQNGGKALIYYSGHGFQILDMDGDEDDGCDEVLVPVDHSQQDPRLITDDEIGRIFEEMKKATVVVIVDSCFSGTITKDIYGSDMNEIKFLDKAPPSCGRASNRKSLVSNRESRESIVKGAFVAGNFVVLTATGENESAYGDLTRSGKGSLLTQSIMDTIAKSRQTLITFRTLRDEAASRIKMVCDASNKIPHTPQLDGDAQFFDKDIYLAVEPPRVPVPAPASYTGGVESAVSNHALLQRVVTNSKFLVAVKMARKQVRLGETIQLSIISSEEGYLNLVEIEPDGGINIVFPNAYASDNHVKADVEVKIPEGIGRFRLEGREPVGRSEVFAFVTRQPLNLFTEGELGNKIGMFKSIGPNELSGVKAAFTRAIGVVPDKPAGERHFGAASVLFEVVR